MAISIADTSSAVSWSQVASTLPHLRKVVRDNVSDSTPTLSFLMGSMGRERREASGLSGDGLPGVIMGGRDIQVPVQLTANTTVGSYSGADPLDITHQDTDRYALFPIRQNAGSLVITGREKRSNKGDAAIYNLIESKVSRLQADLRIELSRQIHSDGTGNAGKDVDGLLAVIGTGTLAGIPPTTFTRWQPGGFASGNTRHCLDTAAGDWTTNDLENQTRTFVNNLSLADSKPDAIISSVDVFGFYENANLQGGIRYTSTFKGDSRFQHLAFAGIPWFFDHTMADGHQYILNSNHVMFMRDTAADFDWVNEGVTPADQDVFVRLLIVEGNVVTDNRRMLGRQSGITE